ncbi:uncharacterized protein YpmS [Bacillus oleivorans]|uniref:Uncharacterized protein YpmS n=1 Tax=Bacillus oleivorans TaxID=1448271 RepID=A0A285CL61_9BACI|nr:YpmS family protein [Bacillus oleivorans]SNX68294.1 uncharacterized protein YpmS [Bacillus oleivorans]
MKWKPSWKSAFWILVGIEFFIVLVLLIIVNEPVERKHLADTELAEENFIPISVQADKKAINDLIQRYLDEKGSLGPVNYSVYVNNDVELIGTFEVFEEEIDFKMDFSAKVLDNGDLWLEEKSLQVGGLEIPSAYILKFVQKKYSLPEWVSIYPNDHIIYIAISKMELNDGTRLRMKHFNLAENRIEVDLLIPKK